MYIYIYTLFVTCIYIDIDTYRYICIYIFMYTDIDNVFRLKKENAMFAKMSFMQVRVE